MKFQLTLLYVLFFLSTLSLKSQIPFWPIGATACLEQGCPGYGGSPEAFLSNGFSIDSTIQGKYCILIPSITGPLGNANHYIHQDRTQVNQHLASIMFYRI